jgi:hypothetical protein
MTFVNSATTTAAAVELHHLLGLYLRLPNPRPRFCNFFVQANICQMKLPLPPRTQTKAPLLVCALLCSAPALAGPSAPIEKRPAPPPASAAEPRDVVLLARVRNPDATLASAQAFIPLPGILQKEVADALGPAKAAVAQRAPLDLVVALDPDSGDKPERPLFAFSIGLLSIEEAQRTIRGPLKGSFVELNRGSYAVQLPMDPDKKSDDLTCLMAPSVGAAPARIVCSDRQRDLDLLAPFMLRTLPAKNLGPADLHAELRVIPATARYGAQIQQGLALGVVAIPQALQLGAPRFDRALTDTVKSFAEELGVTLSELDRATLDLGMGPAGVELRMGYQLRGRKSWLARTLVEEAAKAGPPPDFFYRLPADAGSASYVNLTYSRSNIEALVGPLRALLDAWLEHKALPAADRQALAAALDPKAWPAGASAWASGDNDQAARPAPKGRAQKPAETSLLSSLQGDYYLGVSDAPADAMRDWVKAAVAAYNRPALQAMLKKTLKGLDASLNAPTLRLAPAPRDLPAGSTEVSFSMAIPTDLAEKITAKGTPNTKATKAAKPAKPAGRPVPLALTFFVVPDGKLMWTALGADRATLVRRVKAGLAGDRPLAGRAGIEDLRGNHVAGGYWTLRPMLQEIARIMEQSGKDKDGKGTAERLDRALNVAPNHGETPMLFFTRSVDGPALDREIVVRLPKGMIDDAISIIVSMVNERGKPNP